MASSVDSKQNVNVVITSDNFASMKIFQMLTTLPQTMAVESDAVQVPLDRICLYRETGAYAVALVVNSTSGTSLFDA